MSEKESSKTRSTVRRRHKSTLASTQRFLPIAEVRNDTILLKNGGFRAILEVEALNFNLKSETEQQGIIAGYESFVNTLTFPLQIVIRSSKINIDPYIAQLRVIAHKQENELLRNQTTSYASFIEQLVDVADIMQKRFFVVVPVDMNFRARGFLELFLSWLRPDDSTSRAAQRNKDFMQGSRLLKDRVNLVQAGLENIGLKGTRLSTHKLIELYYQIYNPRTSQEQKLPSEEQMKMEKQVL